MTANSDSLRFFRPELHLAEVVTWDVPTITEEISRLQNSIQHLESTQGILKEQMDCEPDEAEWKVSHDENVDTISSQKERIELLKEALREKGILYDRHYDAHANPPPTHPPSSTHTTDVAASPSRTQEVSHDGGIDL